MTITYTDKQLHEKLKKAQGDFMSDFKTQLYKLVDQAKAEQREADIKIIDTMPSYSHDQISGGLVSRLDLIKEISKV